MACGPATISRWWRSCVTNRDAVEVGLDPAERSHRRREWMQRGFDYIVVFGAAVGADGKPSAVLRHRLEAAVKWAEGRSRVRFLVTGGLGDHPPAEAEVMRSYLLERGFQDRMIMTEPQGLDTLSSAVRCIEILKRRSDADSVVLCSRDICITLQTLEALRNKVTADITHKTGVKYISCHLLLFHTVAPKLLPI